MQWEVRAEPADISIHALHEESDTTANAMLRMLKFQSTLSMRRATDMLVAYHMSSAFQSTLSMRRATALCRGVAGRILHFNPRSP